MSVVLRNDQRKIRLDLRRMKQIAQRLLEAMGRPEAELSVLFVDDRKMTRIHDRWMGEATPTDVLSFAMEGAPRSIVGVPEMLGDIVISAETVARGTPKRFLEKEVVHRMIHGLLHLVGYDHVKHSDRQRMNRRTRSLQRLVSGSFFEVRT